MQIYLGSDHRGFELKNRLRGWLEQAGHSVHDMGPSVYQPTDDYPDYAFLVAERVKNEASATGIVMCGSGVGMAVAANKVAGVRAGLIHDPDMAIVAREHDDINVLALGSDFIDFQQAKQVVEKWLKASYSGEVRHSRRIKKIEDYEQDG